MSSDNQSKVQHIMQSFILNMYSYLGCYTISLCSPITTHN